MAKATKFQATFKAVYALALLLLLAFLVHNETWNTRVSGEVYSKKVPQKAGLHGPFAAGRRPGWRNIPKENQKFRNSWNKRKQPFWDSITPTVSCKAEHLQRTGKEHDGGKWTCGLLHLHSSNLDHSCALFSFGVNGESSFEAAVLETTRCRVFAYDHTVNTIGRPLSLPHPRITFKKLAVGGSNSNSTRTIKALMKENGQDWIEILKVDIEGSEYETLARLLDDFDEEEELPVGQLQVEFHFGLNSSLQHPPPTDRADSSVLPLLEGLESRGLQLFHTELNDGVPDYCSEFSFINTNVHGDLVVEKSKKTNPVRQVEIPIY